MPLRKPGNLSKRKRLNLQKLSPGDQIKVWAKEYNRTSEAKDQLNKIEQHRPRFDAPEGAPKKTIQYVKNLRREFNMEITIYTNRLKNFAIEKGASEEVIKLLENKISSRIVMSWK